MTPTTTSRAASGPPRPRRRLRLAITGERAAGTSAVLARLRGGGAAGLGVAALLELDGGSSTSPAEQQDPGQRARMLARLEAELAAALASESDAPAAGGAVVIIAAGPHLLPREVDREAADWRFLHVSTPVETRRARLAARGWSEESIARTLAWSAEVDLPGQVVEAGGRVLHVGGETGVQSEADVLREVRAWIASETGARAEVTEAAVRELAERWLEPVAAGFAGRFFLAGGAFKSILTGCTPNDLDLWPVDEATRSRLIECLQEVSGMAVASEGLYQTVLTGGAAPCKIEVARNLKASFKASLEELVGSFDLGLSCAAAEWRDGSVVGAFIHPAFHRSVRDRSVYLGERVYENFGLATIQRLHRYAGELGFSVPFGEEAAVWAAFDSQGSSAQRATLANLDTVGRPGPSLAAVETSARARLRDPPPAAAAATAAAAGAAAPPPPIIMGLYRGARRGGELEASRPGATRIAESLRISPWYRDRAVFLAGDEWCAAQLEGHGLTVAHIFADAPPDVRQGAGHMMKHWMCMWALDRYGDFLWLDWDTVSLREPDAAFWAACRYTCTPKFISTPGDVPAFSCSAYYCCGEWLGHMRRSQGASTQGRTDEQMWAAVLPSDASGRPEYWWDDAAVVRVSTPECAEVTPRTYFAHTADLGWAAAIREKAHRSGSIQE